MEHKGGEAAGSGHAHGEAAGHAHGGVAGHAHGGVAGHAHGGAAGHAHGAGGHTYAENHPQHKQARDRIARALGHLQSVARMVEDEADCMDVLIQISAVRSALNGAARLILDDHVRHCLMDAARDGDMEAVDRMTLAVGRFMDLK